MLKHRRFTLIELLIVVAIISILAALLLPALGRAKYQAKLVVCMSNLHQTATAVMVYANSNNSRYPYRKSTDTSLTAFANPYMLRWYNQEKTNDVGLFREMQFEDIQCPFVDPNWSDPTNSITFGYSMYFGWDAKVENCRLLKTRDVMEFNGNTFSVLASDILQHDGAYSKLRTSHPDYENPRLQLDPYQRFWTSVDKIGRGRMDMNVCRTDGSVLRLTGLKQNDSSLEYLPRKAGDAGGAYSRTAGNLLPAD